MKKLRVRRRILSRPGGKTVISIDGQWVKVVHAAGLPQPSIRFLMAQPLKGLDDAQLLQMLMQKVGPETDFEPGVVLIANPSQFTTVRLSNLPSTDPKEIREIIELQAERYTPYAKEEILTGFKVIHQDSSGYSRVLLAISHRDVIQRAVSVVEKLGWPIGRVSGDVEGLVNWFLMSRGGKAGGASSGVVLLADVDWETTSVLILQEGRPYFHRSIACGFSQLASNEPEATAALIGELQRSIEAFEGEGFNLPLHEIVLTGEAERLPGLKDHVQQVLNIPSSVLPTFSRCPISKELAAQASAAQISFTGLIGLALGPSELDLTPPSVKLRQAFEGRARALTVLGGQAIALLLLLSFFAAEKTIKIERLHQALTRENQKISVEAGWVARSMDQLRIVHDRLDNRGTLLEVTAAMSQLLPPEIRLESMTFSAGESVLLKGVSLELPKVFELVNTLSKSPLFTAQVVARRISKRKEEGRDVSDFEILCPLSNKKPNP